MARQCLCRGSFLSYDEIHLVDLHSDRILPLSPRLGLAHGEGPLWVLGESWLGFSGSTKIKFSILGEHKQGDKGCDGSSSGVPGICILSTILEKHSINIRN